jgi:TonB family protein
MGMLNRATVTVLLGCLLAAPGLAQHPMLRVHENHLRTKALSSVMPKFPAKARKAKATGVAVSRITVDESGQVIAVEILEAPHPSIGDELTQTLFKWRFTPFVMRGKLYRARGKLTFYFVKDKQGIRVENPHPW